MQEPQDSAEQQAAATALPPPSASPAAGGDEHSDEQEAFIGQGGIDGFEGEVLDDLDGEGAGETWLLSSRAASLRPGWRRLLVCSCCANNPLVLVRPPTRACRHA
jgi:hypothetical protein